MKFVAFIVAALILGFIGFFLQIKVEFLYRRQEDKDHVLVNLYALKGLIHFKMEIPEVDLQWQGTPMLEVQNIANSKTAGQKTTNRTKTGMRYINMEVINRLWQNIPALLYRFNQVKTKFYQGIHCTALDWRIEIGYRDPAQTAIAAGALWSFVGFAIARLYKQVKMQVSQPKFEVIPQFQKEGFACKIYCIFQMRIGHIMVAGLGLWRIFQLGRKGKLYG